MLLELDASVADNFILTLIRPISPSSPFAMLFKYTIILNEDTNFQYNNV